MAENVFQKRCSARDRGYFSVGLGFQGFGVWEFGAWILGLRASGFGFGECEGLWFMV